MVVLEGVSARARKPPPKVNHHVDALPINHMAPNLTWTMPRHVELAARSNGPGRISMARATCTSSPHAARPGYIRVPRTHESKRGDPHQYVILAHSPRSLGVWPEVPRTSQRHTPSDQVRPVQRADSFGADSTREGRGVANGEGGRGICPREFF